MSCSSKRNRLLGSCMSTLVSSTNKRVGPLGARLPLPFLAAVPGLRLVWVAGAAALTGAAADAGTGAGLGAAWSRGMGSWVAGADKRLASAGRAWVAVSALRAGAAAGGGTAAGRVTPERTPLRRAPVAALSATATGGWSGSGSRAGLEGEDEAAARLTALAGRRPAFLVGAGGRGMRTLCTTRVPKHGLQGLG